MLVAIEDQSLYTYKRDEKAIWGCLKIVLAHIIPPKQMLNLLSNLGYPQSQWTIGKNHLLNHSILISSLE